MSLKLTLRTAMCHCIVAVGVAVALGASAPAQGTIRSVTFYTVKPDRVGDFQAEIKSYNALLAKGGSTRNYSMWLSLTGPHTYAFAANYKTWAELDAGADPKMKDLVTDLARISMRITDCTESNHRVIEELDPDLSLPDSGKEPAMIRVLTTQVRPEKFDDYLALVKSDILPAVKKSGVTDYNIAKGRFGESSSVITSVAAMSNWADLDGGVGAQKALGKEGYQKLLARVRPLIASSQFDIYRFQPDLSYLPPTTK